MAKHPELQSFYSSKRWINFRKMIILDRGPTCEECRRIITEDKQIEVHHIRELTLANINDVMISLNPENMKVLCKQCHNKIHSRFQGSNKKKTKKVFIVYGPPCSGKTTYVMQHKEDEDLVIDMDRLYEAVTLLPRYTKPDKLLLNVISIRNHIIDNIKTRYGKWNNAWIIGGYPDKYRREKLAKDLGAELIFIDKSKIECLNWVKTCNSGRNEKEFAKFIENWFEKYQK